MELIEFRPTLIGKSKIADDIFSKALDEILMNSDTDWSLADNLSVKEYEERVISKLPETKKLTDVLIKEQLIPYAERLFGTEVKSYKKLMFLNSRVDSDAVTSLHEHSLSHITAVFYISANNGDLYINNPLLNCNRGFPKSIKETFFNNIQITPEDGLLIMMPSYVYHSVLSEHSDLRLVLVIDLILNEEELDVFSKGEKL